MTVFDQKLFFGMKFLVRIQIQKMIGYKFTRSGPETLHQRTKINHKNYRKVNKSTPRVLKAQ
jgi:hypothetical protein